MKIIVLLIAIAAISTNAVELKTETETKTATMQLSSLRSIFSRYKGKWVGGGMQTIFSLGSSAPEDRLVPNGFS